MSITRELISRIAAQNDFQNTLTRPTIVVFRSTSKSLAMIPDIGDNICDLICLVDEDDIILCSGRTTQHKQYQAMQMAGRMGCNHIASGWYPEAWMHGDHAPLVGGVIRRYPALIQKSRFVIVRSADMIVGNRDDYVQFLPPESVWDNCHGFAPFSAGCVTIEGAMIEHSAVGVPTGDWARAYAWMYGKHAQDASFDAIILSHEDLDAPRRVRVGSTNSQMVTDIQGKLGLQADGSFGPATSAAVVAVQANNNLFIDGIVDDALFAKIMGGAT